MKTLKFNFISHKAFFNVAILVILAIAITSCEEDDMSPSGSSSPINSGIENSDLTPSETPSSIASIAIGEGFDELVNALIYVDSELGAGLVDLLSSNGGEYTVFAPTNAAFENLYQALEINTITDLPAELVSDVLLYHVVDGRRLSNTILPASDGFRTIDTFLGETFTVDGEGTISAIGSSASIETADVIASNGIIHIIDTVLLPIE